MSTPSNWLLTPGAVRWILPKPVTEALGKHALGRALYPTSMGFYPSAKGHSMRRSIHDDWLMLYCVAGRAILEVNQARHAVEAGHLLLLPPGIGHAYWAMNQDPWTVYWTHFVGEQAGAYLRQVPIPADQFVHTVGVRTGLVSDFKLLLELRHAPHHLKAAVFAAHVLRKLLSYLPLVWPMMPHSRSQLDLEQIHTLMQRQLEGVLRLEELATAAHLSRYQFAHEYRRLTGVPPIAHFIRLKIERACHLLDTTHMSVKEIGGALGYGDPYYFSRVFKKIIGYSPEHYRRLKRG